MCLHVGPSGGPSPAGGLHVAVCVVKVSSCKPQRGGNCGLCLACGGGLLFSEAASRTPVLRTMPPISTLYRRVRLCTRMARTYRLSTLQSSDNTNGKDIGTNQMAMWWLFPPVGAHGFAVVFLRPLSFHRGSKHQPQSRYLG